ncbi:MAG: hypothetical protein II179_01795 [Alphaproteobacteria bacterium]|nr:hypothetical protein [Alphaproteobacteria bacterium]
MGTIIQDYKIYRKAKEAEKSAKTDLETQLRDMVKPISLSDLNGYMYQVKAFIIYAESVYNGNNVKALTEYLNEKGPLVRAPSCFCRVSVAPYLKPNSIIGAIIATEIIKEERDKPIKENDIIKCIHNREDGTIYENCCSKCPKERFKALVEYHSLHGKYTDALNATMLAKQTLFTHFPFIKQKTSH